MHVDDIDRELQRLRSAVERIGANLLTLERDPNRALLESVSLRGVSAERWTGARDEIADLFRWFTTLGDVLERAVELRGTRSWVAASRESRLVALLTTPSIEVSDATVPLGARGLLDGSTKVERCTPDELIARMSTAFDRVRAVISEAADVWDGFVPRLAQAREELMSTRRLADALGGPTPTELDRLERRLGELGDLALTDPLAVDPGSADAIAREIDRLHTELEGAERLRAELHERIAEARALLQDLERVIDTGAAEHPVTTTKIAGACVPQPIAVDPARAERLDAILALGVQGNWPAAQRALTEWERETVEHLHRAEELVRAIRAPLEERDQLRGLLGAYREKAFGVGVGEDPDLAVLHDAVHRELYTAPTDLAAAAEMVRRYRDAIATAGRERR